LAAAHVLWKELNVAGDVITFDSLSGPLTARLEEDWIHLNFPAKFVNPTPMPELLNKALGYRPVTSVYKDDTIYLVVLPSAKDVADIKPNLAKISDLDCRAVTVTAINNGGFDKKFDFVSRYFAPKVGIPEDPVCGSAHCRLVPFWAEQLQKNEFTAYQASKRGGCLKLKLVNDRVFLGGQAITFSVGEIYF
jgi:predicted PhzF superfamily epimerase YddE/YHI9